MSLCLLMNQLTSIYFKNGSYLETFFKEHQFDQSARLGLFQRHSLPSQKRTCWVLGTAAALPGSLRARRLGTNIYKYLHEN